MKDGLLHFDCPKCGETLAVSCHIVSEFTKPTREAFGTIYSHFVEFIVETPHLHAQFWNHLVTCHQPNPHPYMGGNPDDCPDCGCPRHRCEPLWPDHKKCCPDCKHPTTTTSETTR